MSVPVCFGSGIAREKSDVPALASYLVLHWGVARAEGCNARGAGQVVGTRHFCFVPPKSAQQAKNVAGMIGELETSNTHGAHARGVLGLLLRNTKWT